jgi:hypothetical protein
MEAAATPLHSPRIHVLANAVIVERLAVHDERAVALVRARSEAGEDVPALISEAIEIGARVLDREQAEANAEWMKAEFEKSSREIEASFVEKAKAVAEFFDQRVDQVFGPENGQLAKELGRLFGDGSSEAVQHQLRQVMSEATGRMREDLLKQFSSADGSNPLADFKAGTMAAMKRAAEQQDLNLKAMGEQLSELRLELQKLQAEKEKLAEVAAEHGRSTAKGRPYEEAVFEAVDAIAEAQGDDCDAVGDHLGTGGRKGDVLVGLDGCAGPPRGRIVFEAKHSQVARKKALEELDQAMAQRDAQFAVWVVPSEDLLPARTHELREVNGDKLFVVYDPEDGSRLTLEVAYKLARARVLMARGEADGVDAGALQTEVERALIAMEDVRRIKAQLTSASGGIEQARQILDAMAARVREHLERIDNLVAEPGAPRRHPQLLDV